MQRTDRNDNTVQEQDRPLVVSAKEASAFPVCSLCQGENYKHHYYKSSFAKQMLLNAKWVITPTKRASVLLVCVCVFCLNVMLSVLQTVCGYALWISMLY